MNDYRNIDYRKTEYRALQMRQNDLFRWGFGVQFTTTVTGGTANWIGAIMMKRPSATS